jgi:hypothetical protein
MLELFISTVGNDVGVVKENVSVFISDDIAFTRKVLMPF